MATVSGAGSTWTNSGTLHVGNQGNGTLTIEAGGTVASGNALIADQLGSTGTVTVSGIGSTWTNSFSLTVGNVASGTLTIEAGGSVSSVLGNIGLGAASNSTIRVTGTGSTWTNSGSLFVGRNGTGMLTFEAGGSVSGEISEISVIGSAANSIGTVTVTGGGSSWTTGQELYVGRFGSGTLSISAGSTVSSDSAFVGTNPGARGMVTVDGLGSTWTNSGDLEIGGSEFDPSGMSDTLIVSGGGAVSVGGLLFVEPAGTVAGNSTLSAFIVNRGVVSPGLDPGLLTGATPGALDIDGNFLQAASGGLLVRLAGTTPGSDYDQLQVSGAVFLNGTLSVALANSFMPTTGNVFDILDWGSLSGTFDTLQLPMLAAGLEWDTSQLYVSGMLSVVPLLPGDFNHDGKVDAADYVAWRKGVGVATTPANYDLWRTNFGRTAGSGASVSTNGFSQVPEPASAILIVAGIVIGRLTVSRRRR